MSLPHGLSLQTLLHTLECVDVTSAHESVHLWMIETQVLTESGSMVLIIDVRNKRGGGGGI